MARLAASERNSATFGDVITKRAHVHELIHYIVIDIHVCESLCSIFHEGKLIHISRVPSSSIMPYYWDIIDIRAFSVGRNI